MFKSLDFVKNYFNYFFNIYKLESFYINETSTFFKKSSLTLFFQNLLFSRKGLQYIFKLPVNGQRTWSNARTVKKLSSFLIDEKAKQFKKILTGAVNLNNLKLIIYLNYFNWIWKLFWKKDWIFLFKRNKKIYRKNIFSKKKQLTLPKMLNYRAPNKRFRKKDFLDLKNILNFIGLDKLIKLK